MKFLNLLPLTVLLASCAVPMIEEDAPIDEETFSDLLADIRLVEGMYSLHYGTISRDQLASMYIQVFFRHGTTQDDFKKSMLIYQTNPDRMMQIEEAVLARLSLLDVSADTEPLSDFPALPAE